MLKKEQQTIEEDRLNKMQRRLEKSEKRYQSIKKAKERDQALLKIHIHRKLEKANIKIQHNLEKKEAEYARKQRELDKKFEKIEKIKEEHQRLNFQKAKLKEFEQNNVRNKGDSLVSEKLREYEERERKFEERLKRHIKSMEREKILKRSKSIGGAFFEVSNRWGIKRYGNCYSF